ncbi:response regulator [Sulfitobacter sabulilitoris]|nr:response regulator [Sulfitobacter sabulilitoris]
MKILAVDDDQFILELVPTLLGAAGYDDITTVSSGAEALAAIRRAETDFDCLLFDIQMPGMDGIELCAQVRRMRAYRRVPIIMLTAMAEKDFIERAFAAGATDYITKPFDIAEMTARIRVAEKLVTAKFEADQSEGGRIGYTRFGAGHAFALADEVKIDEVDRLIDFFALGNYVSQLSRTGLSVSQVFAVKIDGVADLYARATTDEFMYALTEFADCISQVLVSDGYLMSYAGNGVFICISNNPALLPCQELEENIQALLTETNPTFDDGQPMALQASVGSPLRPNASRTQRVKKTFDRVVARVETRSDKKERSDVVEQRIPDRVASH